MSFKTIDQAAWDRKKHFDFFRQFEYPHFNICANVDITAVRKLAKDKGYSLFKCILYLTSRVANEIPEFRQRIRGNEVVEHESVHPSYTSMTEAKVFTFTDVYFDFDAEAFFQACEEKENEVKSEATLEDNPHRDDYLFITSIPWVHFTSFVHPIRIEGGDSVPRISWGKYVWHGEKLLLPLSVQAHHALVDGLHTGQYFEKMDVYAAEPEGVGL